DLPAIAPPQAHREQLLFALQVIPNEQLRVVANAVIHATHPLVIVLVKGWGIYVVESTCDIGIRVRLWIELHQALHVLVDQAGRDDATRVGCHVLYLSGRTVGSRLIALFGDLGWGEVAREL